MTMAMSIAAMGKDMKAPPLTVDLVCDVTDVGADGLIQHDSMIRYALRSTTTRSTRRLRARSERPCERPGAAGGTRQWTATAW
jgi:hypothetical protein